MPNILVIGSINMDMVARIDHIPLQGESVLGEGYSFNPGGKGANSAVAAARLGGKVSFAGCVGRDDYGKALRKVLQDENVDDALLAETADAPTGYAPILVQKKDDYYEIIAGERRWRAAKLAGIKEVPVIIKDFTEQEVVEISLIENIQRESLNPIEEAHAYKRLMEEFHLRQDEIAERVSKSRTAVTNSMRLLKLDDRVQQMVVDEMLTTGHVRTLLALENKELQYNTAMKIFDEKLSVRETERLVKEILNPKVKKEKKVNLEEEAIYEGLEEKIKSIIGTKVSIHRGAKHKGKIEIEYYSQEELERIMDLFESIQ